MTQPKGPSPAAQRGFSLTELMVALVAGLIVSYAVVAFVMASMKSNAEYIQSTKLNQSLRNTLDLVVRDLRRAGYDGKALARLAGGSTNSGIGYSPFTKVYLDTSIPDRSCIIYAYDKANVATGSQQGALDKANGEIRGLRMKLVTPSNTGSQVGVIEYAVSNATDAKPTCSDATATYTSYPPACNGNWCPLTDASTINIRAFSISQSGAATVGSDPIAVAVRNLQIKITGRLVGDDATSYLGVSSSYKRGLQATVKVRSDCINATIASCNVSP